MREIDIEEAARDLSQLVDGMAAGDEVVLTREGRSIAKLTPVRPRQKIRLGLLKGQFKVPDDFDAPLPEDILALFEGEPTPPTEADRGDGKV